MHAAHCRKVAVRALLSYWPWHGAQPEYWIRNYVHMLHRCTLQMGSSEAPALLLAMDSSLCCLRAA
eukprot:1161539-Pelagomonas_calceolata.AAC.9